MHLTFVNLFLKARKLGSNFWLGMCFSCRVVVSFSVLLLVCHVVVS